MDIFLQIVIAPIFVAFIAYYVFGQIDERKKRKMHSLLGVELLTILITEIEIGYSIIMEPLHLKDNPQPNPLPLKSWNGIGTFQNEILIRIFEVSKDIPDYEYHPSRIRIHTKNYYEYMIPNWEKVVEEAWIESQFESQKEHIIEFKQAYGKGTHDLLQMLEETHKLLRENANKTFPK